MINIECWICKKNLPAKYVSTTLSYSGSGAKIKTDICYNCLSRLDYYEILRIIDDRLTELDNIYDKGIKEGGKK